MNVMMILLDILVIMHNLRHKEDTNIPIFKQILLISSLKSMEPNVLF